MKMKSTLTVLLIVELYGLSFGLKQHFFVNEEKKWICAQRHCQHYYHGLSTFPNKSQEQRFLAYATSQTSDAWVGLYRKPGTEVWKWLEHLDAKQISWDTDPSMIQSNNRSNQNCAFLHKDHKKLRNERCNLRQPFFCMTNFVLVRQNMTWDGALEYCRTHYNDLAILNTEERMYSALLEVSQAETEYVWTGLRYLAGHWFWVSGDGLYYTAWYQNNIPKCPARDLRCGALDNETRLWKHRNCEEKFTFFCQ